MSAGVPHESREVHREHPVREKGGAPRAPFSGVRRSTLSASTGSPSRAARCSEDAGTASNLPNRGVHCERHTLVREQGGIMSAGAPPQGQEVRPEHLPRRQGGGTFCERWSPLKGSEVL